MLSTVLFVAATVFFLLAAFRVPGPVDWVPAGYACLSAALFLM